MWRLVDRTPSSDVGSSVWVVHHIHFFQHFVLEKSNGVPQCFSPVLPSQNASVRAADRGWQEDYTVHNAFGGYVGKPLKSQLREPSSGESPSTAWIGLESLGDINVTCIQVYQSHLSTYNGTSFLALEQQMYPGGKWQQKAVWNFAWSSLSGNRSKSMWMTLAVGNRAVSSYTECSVTDTENGKCCVWPRVVHDDESSILDTQRFQIPKCYNSSSPRCSTNESAPKCAQGATVLAGSTCPFTSNVCSGFEGVLHCVGGSVRMEIPESRDPSEECSMTLATQLKSGSRVWWLRFDDTTLDPTMHPSYDDTAISEDNEADDEADEEEDDELKEDHEDWHFNIIHKSNTKTICIILGVAIVLCLPGFAAWKLWSQSNLQQRFNDADEASQMQKTTALLSPFGSGIEPDTRDHIDLMMGA